MNDFDESKHPRGKDGKFIYKGREFYSIKLKPETKEKLKRYFEKVKAKRKPKTQDEHLDKWTEPPALAEQMKGFLNVSEKEAKTLTVALSSWADGSYRKIREAQFKNNLSSKHFITAMLLESYIEKAPKWSGKPIYRGLKLTQSQIDKYKVGGVFNMRGVSSWTSQKGVAEFFANRDKKPNEKEVILINKNGTTQGASITHMAKYKKQYEVLVSYKAKHIITEKYNSGKHTIIVVEEKRNER